MDKFYVCGLRATAEGNSLTFSRLEVEDNFLDVCYDYIDCRCLDVRQVDLHNLTALAPKGTWIDIWFDDEFLFREIKDDELTLAFRLPYGEIILGNVVISTFNDEGETCEFPSDYIKYLLLAMKEDCFAGLPPEVARDYMEKQLSQGISFEVL